MIGYSCLICVMTCLKLEVSDKPNDGGKAMGIQIPDETVEAAARAHYGLLTWGGPDEWGFLHKQGQDELLALTRAALEAAAPYMLIHVHHHDIEKHAESFNEGYETAMAQELAEDPTTAQDWLDEKLGAAWDAGHAAGLRREFEVIAHMKAGEPTPEAAPNPYRPTP